MYVEKGQKTMTILFEIRNLIFLKHKVNSFLRFPIFDDEIDQKKFLLSFLNYSSLGSNKSSSLLLSDLEYEFPIRISSSFAAFPSAFN